jgi:fumarate hydratase class II
MKPMTENGRERSTPPRRVERDSMGPLEVPEGAYYGASTQRAVENFPISGERFDRRFIWALGTIKYASAIANRDLGLIDPPAKAEAIAQAAAEVAGPPGKFDDQFVLDIFQTGSGTSTNTNANEVIASRAAELLGLPFGAKAVHPNDDVNRGQSSNDVIPTAMHLAALAELQEVLIPAVERLRLGSRKRARSSGRSSRPAEHISRTPRRFGSARSSWATPARWSGRCGDWPLRVMSCARLRSAATRSGLASTCTRSFRGA